MLALPPIARDCSTAEFLALVSVVVSTLMSFLAGSVPDNWPRKGEAQVYEMTEVGL